MRKNYLRVGLIVLVLATAFSTPRELESRGAFVIDTAAGHAPCGGWDADSWVIQEAERVRNNDGLFRFSVTEFGQPIVCEGIVTDEFDGAKFGRVTFRFLGDVTFERETMPPSVIIVTLRGGAGFSDPAKVQEALRSYTSAYGLSIVWEAPERSVDGDMITEQFWDPDPGLNGSASLTWSSGALMSVRVSQAP